MTTTEQFALVAQRCIPDGRLIRYWPLTGGISAETTALLVAHPGGGEERLVVRRHGAIDLAANPRIAATEYRLLQLLQAEGIPVPRPRLLDESCAILPSPYVVIEYIDGSPDDAPQDDDALIDRMAAQLAAIHRLTPLCHDLSFLPDQAATVIRRLQEGSADGPDWFPAARIRASLLAAWPLRHSDPPTLLHGDFWAGNLLWRAGQLMAVIDWEDAKVGDPLADLAKARLELLWFHGEAAMHRFTERYLELTGRERANLSVWDLYVAWWSGVRLSGWGLAPDAERSMRAGLNRFIELTEAARRDH